MRVVYDPSHVLHDPVTEVQYGVAIPVYEVPARGEAIHAAVLADDEFSFADPADHGLGPVTAVHHEGLVRFLAEAWSLWQVHVGGSDSLPSSQYMPDTVLHPAMGEGMGEAPEPSPGRRGTFTVCGRSTVWPAVAPRRCDLHQRPATMAVWGAYGARSSLPVRKDAGQQDDSRNRTHPVACSNLIASAGAPDTIRTCAHGSGVHCCLTP
jgi:hypothetical protein